MPWETIEQVPEEVKVHAGVPLDINQANKWAEIYDAVVKEGIVENPAAIAWDAWHKLYQVSEDEKTWISIEKEPPVPEAVPPVEETTCSDCKSGTCTNDKVFSSSAPRLYQLAEEDAKRTGESELLMLFGTAIAEGEWKDVTFPAKVLQEGLERVTNKRIDVDHEDETWNDVKGFIFKPVWNSKLKGIDVSGTIFDERVINWYKANPEQKIGWSVKMADDAKYEIIGGKKTCTYFNIKGIALTLSPACKVCWVSQSETVQLSSSKSLDVGDNMVDEKPKEQPKEELKEQPKEEVKTVEPKAQLDAAKDTPTATGAETTPPKEEVKAPEQSEASAPSLKEFNELKAKVEQLEKQNSSLSQEKGLSETKAMVDNLITSGQLSEAKRESATIALNALPSGEGKAAFLSAIGTGNWKSSEQGLVLSEEKKADKPEQFSEPERKVIT